ncbi:uncharacterized protein LOC116267810 isoform X2 [Nymphaea colorata]|nr:uncharacterized protein LOC116267810 isoform X2 [Nymphaea colorata]
MVFRILQMLGCGTCVNLLEVQKMGKWQSFLKGRPKTSTRLQGFTDGVSAKGLQYTADTIKSGTDEKSKTNAMLQNGIDESENNFKGLTS